MSMVLPAAPKSTSMKSTASAQAGRLLLQLLKRRRHPGAELVLGAQDTEVLDDGAGGTPTVHPSRSLVAEHRT